jgi:hypothetical protein
VDVFAYARNLKNEAMEARDEGRFEEARQKLREAEHTLEAALAEQRSVPKQEENRDLLRRLAAQLVHIRGSIGGVWRREGSQREADVPRRVDSYRQAAVAYDAAYDLEREPSGYGIVDSYTMVQRLVTRVFLDPASPDADRPPVEGVEVRTGLRRAAEVIREQVDTKGRERDEFAAADLALVLLLLGGNDWPREMRRFLELRPGYALTATMDVLQELLDWLSSTGDRPALRERLQAGVAMLGS